jgi:hypothetical protein
VRDDRSQLLNVQLAQERFLEQQLKHIIVPWLPLDRNYKGAIRDDRHLNVLRDRQTGS